jgi:hypothetical protein
MTINKQVTNPSSKKAKPTKALFEDYYRPRTSKRQAAREWQGVVSLMLAP